MCTGKRAFFVQLFQTSLLVVFLVLSGNAKAALGPTEADYHLKLLGKFVFFDNISSPTPMSCATCHVASAGWTVGNSTVNLTQVAMNGANPHTVGGLKTPSNAYATLIEPFHLCNIGGVAANVDHDNDPTTPTQRRQYCGGNFWNGRAEGLEVPLFNGATKPISDEVFTNASGVFQTALADAYVEYLGPVADQALNPFPNDVEQNVPDGANDNGIAGAQFVCNHVKKSAYAGLFKKAWGEAITCTTRAAVNFKRIAVALAAYQASTDVNSFSSKRDSALQAELLCVNKSALANPAVCNHVNYINSPGKFPLVGLTDQENLGHDLFYNSRPPFGPNPPPAPFPNLPITQCAFCHISDTAKPDGTGLLERYADDAYHSIGTPANPELPAAPNPGLGGHVDGFAPGGGFKTPTLRNVDKRPSSTFVKAYTHNGWFKSLESIVHFYNTAAIGLPSANSFGITRCDITRTWTEAEARLNNCWPLPEWTAAAPQLIGNIGMTAAQETALVSYLKALSDKVTPTAPTAAQLAAALK